ncbi:MAG TPA: MurR/RpiR family transcriptional regulator [Solirubrobacteraceae bacterium]|nr:MurR/RpiR family transcriptional regulator [Solirubrobacteraceae bacterium]
MKRAATPTTDRRPADPRGHGARATREKQPRQRAAGATRTSRSAPQAEAAEAPREAPGSEHQSLSKYIRARFDECSRSQKDVAQYIVDHLDEAAFQTAEELARRANTSSSTVVRFSQALGFEGFPELQAAAREEYRRVHAQPQANGTPENGGPLFSLDQNEFETALAADHLNLEETARKVSRSSVESLIEAIVAADKVLVAGTDQMAFFASYLRHLLMLLDLRVDVVASPSQEALSRLGRIDENTLVIGLTAGRPHPLVVRAMKLARHRKAPAAAITDATLSEVAKLAQIKLYYSSNSPAYVRSHAALLSIIQALAYGVYAQDSAQYDDRIKAFRLK